ncbi:sodium-dependent transporter [Arhodomonas aquaeolei]|uniref:sodium-dependent transporter n=1 Tax=Arhodomonas TaxID=2368 RepID=UPI002168857D|nr:sodium-dependent transporter [Arhodomonas aquaeolei]MCS4505476.1 sodium-dependent transporter [Arhodomonas aquaeolei]
MATGFTRPAGGRGVTLLLVGATVGLGNVWRFPWLVGEYGGGAFLLLYLLCLAGLGLPLMIAELVIGERAGVAAPRGLGRLAIREGHSRAWGVIGVASVAAGVLLLPVYGIVGGWSLAYIFRAAGGSFEGLDTLAAARLFRALVHDGEALLGWYTLFIGAAVLVAGRDVRYGIEVAARWFVPLLAVLLGALVAAQWESPGLPAALAFLFVPDWGAVTVEAVLAALGHAFFTLSLGAGVMIAFGAYCRGGVIFPAVATVVMDTLFAVLAGLAVLPALFNGGLSASGGAGLAFQTLPVVFGGMSGGDYLGVLFFAALSLAAWTSTCALMEPAVAWLSASPRRDRPMAAAMVGVVVWVLGLVPLLTLGMPGRWQLPVAGGMGLFEALNRGVAAVVLPLVGLGVALYAGWVLSPESVRIALRRGAAAPVWRFLVRFVAPAALVVIGVEASGFRVG